MIVKIFLGVAVLLTIATTCVQQSRHPVKHKATTSPPSSSPGVIRGESWGILVSPQWMERYKKMEMKGGKIYEDANIYQEGIQYRIPREVADHFNDMIRSSQ